MTVCGCQDLRRHYDSCLILLLSLVETRHLFLALKAAAEAEGAHDAAELGLYWFEIVSGHACVVFIPTS